MARRKADQVDFRLVGGLDQVESIPQLQRLVLKPPEGGCHSFDLHCGSSRFSSAASPNRAARSTEARACLALGILQPAAHGAQEEPGQGLFLRPGPTGPGASGSCPGRRHCNNAGGPKPPASPGPAPPMPRSPVSRMRQKSGLSPSGRASRRASSGIWSVTSTSRIR